jgi:hypothetical protein
MGVKTSLATTVIAASHTAATTKIAGRAECDCTAASAGPDRYLAGNDQDMQAGDSNITAFQTLIINLS